MIPIQKAEPPRLLLVSNAESDAGRLRTAGIEVAAFRCGLAALGHWDAGGGPFDAVVIDEAPAGLSGQTLTLALRAAGFRGPLFGLSGDPETTAEPWRQRGCDMVVSRRGDWAGGIARLLPRRAGKRVP